MFEFLIDIYPWLKALHIIAVISWMAGMLYLPRLFVYHANSAVGSDQAETFKIMERRLSNVILTPAMVLSILLGIILLLVPDVIDWAMVWVWGKLLFVFALLLSHGALMRWRKAFEADRNQHTAKFFRIFNEVPTVIMIIIVILAVVKPF